MSKRDQEVNLKTNLLLLGFTLLFSGPFYGQILPAAKEAVTIDFSELECDVYHHNAPAGSKCGTFKTSVVGVAKN